MNTLTGVISNVKQSNHLTMVEVDVSGISLKSIVLETEGSSSHLKIGSEIKVLFKETEVVLAKGSLPLISLQNRIEGAVIKVEAGELLSRVIMNTTVGEIHSVITSASVNRLEIVPGDQLIALIKTNEVMLAE